MPVTLKGARQPLAIAHEVAVASAQVKSALILAALNAPGRSRIVQRALTRDHTERMLRAFGATIAVEELKDGGEAVRGDRRSRSETRDGRCAARSVVGCVPAGGGADRAGIEVTLPDVLLNPRRIGLIDTLKEMGADIAVTNERERWWREDRRSPCKVLVLKGVDVPAERAPSMIDEYPILAVAAAFAEGRTTMRGLEELRVKESDRLAAIGAGLRANGVGVEEPKTA
ncbi:MAG: hypothetical protein WDM89_09840 [Rhizomicrobium sp.]